MSANRKQVCLDTLSERILTLAIEPGHMLDEQALAEEFGLSRTPLREVIQRLSGNGYVQVTENRGAKVSSMDFTNMRDFFQTAPMIYAAIARLAAENATPSQVIELKEVQTGFRTAVEAKNPRDTAMFNHRFHALIGEMAGNPYLLPSLHRLLIDHTRMSQVFYSPENDRELELVDTACRHHDQMIEAVETRQPAIMVDLTLQHWALSRDRIERFAHPDPLDFDLGGSNFNGEFSNAV